MGRAARCSQRRARRFGPYASHPLEMHTANPDTEAPARRCPVITTSTTRQPTGTTFYGGTVAKPMVRRNFAVTCDIKRPATLNESLAATNPLTHLCLIVPRTIISLISCVRDGGSAWQRVTVGRSLDRQMTCKGSTSCCVLASQHRKYHNKSCSPFVFIPFE
jgi:hypothetical protein